MTGYVLLVFLTPHTHARTHMHKLGGESSLEMRGERKENVSLYVCYVTQSDTVLPPTGQFLMCLPCSSQVTHWD